MTIEYLITAIAAMIIITYALRVLSIVLFRKKFTNKFIYSFLNYTPYGVLAALIFPGIFYCTADASGILSLEQFICAALGTAVALILAFFKKSLMTVSICAVVTVFIAQQIAAVL